MTVKTYHEKIEKIENESSKVENIYNFRQINFFEVFVNNIWTRFILKIILNDYLVVIRKFSLVLCMILLLEEFCFLNLHHKPFLQMYLDIIMFQMEAEIFLNHSG